MKLAVKKVCGSDEDDRMKELGVLCTAMERAQVQLHVLSESSGAELDHIEKVIVGVKPSVAEYQQKTRMLKAHMAAVLKEQKNP